MGERLSLGITYREDLLTVREHGKLARDLMRDELRHHQLRFLPKHFEARSENRVGGAYNIAPRTIRWVRRKQREGKPNIPNLYKGDLRASVLQRSRITATQHKGQLIARQIYKLRPDARLQRNKEIETITPAEMQHHRRRMGKNYVNLASSKSSGYRRQRQVRTKKS